MTAPDRFEDVDVNGNLLARYVHSTGVDESQEEIASGTTSYYQQDGLGSVTSLSSTTGAIGNNSYTYDSYGNTTSSATVVNPFRYSGREFDTESGVYHYRARYYDPSVGRFLSEDPLRFKAGINFYSYVKNNPVVDNDPSGLAPAGECKCEGSGGKPLFGVCGPYTCVCSCEIQPEPAWFPIYLLKRDCGWREKRCPMVIEGSSNPRMYGSVVESIKAEKCYDTRPQ
jgi:RHS repeat-associated protein